MSNECDTKNIKLRKIIILFVILLSFIVFNIFRSDIYFYYTVSKIRIGMNKKNLYETIKTINYSDIYLNENDVEIVFGDLRGFIFGDFIKINIHTDKNIVTSISGEKYNIEDFSGTKKEFFRR